MRVDTMVSREFSSIVQTGISLISKTVPYKVNSNIILSVLLCHAFKHYPKICEDFEDNRGLSVPRFCLATLQTVGHVSTAIKNKIVTEKIDMDSEENPIRNENTYGIKMYNKKLAKQLDEAIMVGHEVFNRKANLNDLYSVIVNAEPSSDTLALVTGTILCRNMVKGKYSSEELESSLNSNTDIEEDYNNDTLMDMFGKLVTCVENCVELYNDIYNVFVDENETLDEDVTKFLRLFVRHDITLVSDSVIREYDIVDNESVKDLIIDVKSDINEIELQSALIVSGIIKRISKLDTSEKPLNVDTRDVMTSKIIATCLAYEYDNNNIPVVLTAELLKKLAEDKEYEIQVSCEKNLKDLFEESANIFNTVNKFGFKGIFLGVDDMGNLVTNSVDTGNGFTDGNGLTVNMNKMAEAGKYDKAIERDKEILRLIEILGRRDKRNAIIVGNAGVGKTAIVEELANRLCRNEVPEYLKGKTIHSLTSTSLVAGAKFRGEAEERVKRIVEEFKKSGDILFIDEIHQLVGLGGSGGSEDPSLGVSDLLKSELTRNGIQVIGCTTVEEYNKKILKDKALSRRFEQVEIDEPNIDTAIKIVNNKIKDYETFHNVKFQSGVCETVVRLSDRYIKDRMLPDKAFTIIDSTASRNKLKNKRLVTEKDIRETIANMTGIAVEKLGQSDLNKLKNLDRDIKKCVIGQDEAIEIVVKAVKRNKVGIRNNNRPIGAFLFMGPTGVGKTELAKVLAEKLMGSENNMIRFDMSEYMEKNDVNKLIGAPPGYVGYSEGGTLTNSVRRYPESIVLFDEIEKAHPDVCNVLLQVLDEGSLTDSLGEKIDFRNTLIIFTSNIGHSKVVDKHVGFTYGNTENTDTVYKGISEDQEKSLKEFFKPEFLNRLDKVINFNSLKVDDMYKITSINLNKLADRLKTNSGIEVKFNKSVISYLADKGYSKEYGARNLNRLIQENVEDIIAEGIINNDINKSNSGLISYDDGKVQLKSNSIKVVKNKLKV